jgi:hypothetical protein
MNAGAMIGTLGDSAALPMPGGGARDRVVSRGLWIAAAIAVTVGVLVFVSERPKDDVAWLVYLAERVLHGERLYVDLIDVNLPLIVVLSAVPASVAEWLGLPALLAFYVAATFIVVLCAWMAALLLRGYSPVFADWLRTTAFLVVVLVLAPGAEFGQREHLFAALALPYLALLALRLRGGSLRPMPAILVGVLGGIGFGLKPHFLLVLALLEMGAVHRGLRILRWETAAVALALSAHALMIAVFFPAYVTAAVTLSFAYYRAYGSRWDRMLRGARYLLALGALNFALHRYLRERPGRDPLAFVLAVFGVAGAVVYVLQWKGWFYHSLPCYVALALSTAYLLATPRATDWRGRLPVGMSVLVASLGAIGCESLVHASRKDVAVRQLATLVRRDHVRSLLVLSRSLSPAFPVVNQTGVRWTSRFDTTWALVAESSLAQQGDVSAQRRPILRQIVEDFVMRQPDLVAVDARDPVGYLCQLSTEPAFVGAWQEYRETARIGRFRVFTHGRRRWTCDLSPAPLPRR